MTEPVVAVLDIPAESRFIASARNFVAEHARAAGWLEEARLEDLRLVVSESVTNSLRAQAIRHVDEQVRIRVVVSPESIEVSVFDSAGGFELPEGPVALPEPDAQPEGGFGIPIIEALTDEMYVSPSDGGTVVRVVVHRTHPGDAQA